MLKKSAFLLFFLCTFLFSGENSYLQNNAEEVKLPQDKVISINSEDDKIDDSALSVYLQ